MHPARRNPLVYGFVKSNVDSSRHGTFALKNFDTGYDMAIMRCSSLLRFGGFFGRVSFFSVS